MICEHCKDPILKFQKRIVISGDKETPFHEGCYEIVIDELRKNAVKSNKSVKPTSNMYDDLVKLRRLLGPTGNFSICRKDGTPMLLPDQMLFGDLFVRIDAELERHLTNQSSRSQNPTKRGG